MKPSFTLTRPISIFVAVLLTSAISGCGQRGPLYLPKTNQSAPAVSAPAQPPVTTGVVPSSTPMAPVNTDPTPDSIPASR